MHPDCGRECILIAIIRHHPRADGEVHGPWAGRAHASAHDGAPLHRYTAHGLGARGLGYGADWRRSTKKAISSEGAPNKAISSEGAPNKATSSEGAPNKATSSEGAPNKAISSAGTEQLVRYACESAALKLRDCLGADPLSHGREAVLEKIRACIPTALLAYLGTSLSHSKVLGVASALDGTYYAAYGIDREMLASSGELAYGSTLTMTVGEPGVWRCLGEHSDGL